MSKLPSERKMVAAAISLRALLQQLQFPISAEVAVTGFLFGLLLREIPEHARSETLAAFNDVIDAVESDDAFRG
jgi:hypothetical protein